MNTPAIPAPGWYPDPSGKAGRRYWDGRAWSSEQTPQSSPVAEAAASTSASYMRWGIVVAYWMVMIGLLALISDPLWATLTLLVGSVWMAIVVVREISVLPAWAFERAHRMPKGVWMTIAVICLVPPLGMMSAVYMARGFAIKQAWIAEDPAGYEALLLKRRLRREARVASMQQKSADRAARAAASQRAENERNAHDVAQYHNDKFRMSIGLNPINPNNQYRN